MTISQIDRKREKEKLRYLRLNNVLVKFKGTYLGFFFFPVFCRGIHSYLPTSGISQCCIGDVLKGRYKYPNSLCNSWLVKKGGKIKKIKKKIKIEK